MYSSVIETILASATPEQCWFIAELAAATHAHDPPFEITQQQEREIIEHWQVPSVAFVAHAASVGPALAARLWQQMQATHEPLAVAAE